MNRYLKSIISAAVAAVLALTAVILPRDDDSVLYINAGAEASSVELLPAGDDLVAEDIELTEEEILELDKAVAADYAKVAKNDRLHPKTSISPLTSIDHTAYTFYKQMSTAEQKVWNDLAAACDKFLCSTVDLSSPYTYTDPSKENYGFVTYPCTGHIEFNTSAVPVARAKNLCELFGHCNPQYYYIYNISVYDKGYIIVWAMNDCATYAKRRKYESTIAQKTEEWLNDIADKESVYEKELAVCDIIRDNMEYDYGAFNKTDEYDWHDQTILGAMYDELCVCAGYAQTFTYLCNAAGIEAVAVRKKGVHRWNRVNIYGTWYETDTTWYDTSGGNKKWLNKSHAYILNADSKNYHIHTTSYYTGFVTLPDCVDDTVYTVSSVEVTTLPKTEYFEGDKFSTKGGVVTATLTNGKTFTANLAKCRLSGFNANVPSEQDITVRYEGAETTYRITVNALEMTDLSISSMPRTVFALGETLDLTGGMLRVTYNSGNNKTINMTSDMVSGFDSSAIGKCTLTVTLGELSVTYDISVIKAPVAINDKPYTDIDTAFAEMKGLTGDVDIVLTKSLTATKTLTLPKKATSIIISGAGEDITLTLKNSSLTFACPAVIRDIDIKNNKNLPIPITAKKSLVIENTLVGTLKTSDNADITGSVISGNFTASGKTFAVGFTDSDVTGNLTAAGRLEILGECAVGGKLTPKGAFRAKGKLKVMT